MKKVLIIPAICGLMQLAPANEMMLLGPDVEEIQYVSLMETIGVKTEELSTEEKIGVLIGNDMGRALKNLPFELEMDVFLDKFAKSFKATYQTEEPIDEMELMELAYELQSEILELEKNKFKENWDPEKIAEISEGFEKSPSGLFYRIKEAGEAKIQPMAPFAEIKVFYEGKLLDGTVFDSNIGEESRTFRLNDLVKGWQEGLPMIGKGGKIELIIPPELGYGPGNQNSPIPPWSALVFTIELLDFNNSEPPKPPQHQITPEMLQQMFQSM